MMLVPVQSRDLDQWLGLIEWHLESFCHDGAATPDDLIADLKAKTRQLWVAWDGEVKGVLLTQIADDRLRTCRMTHCAGAGYRAWIEFFDVIEGWARAEGCQRLMAVARPGWEKPLKRFGLEKSHVILEKRL